MKITTLAVKIAKKEAGKKQVNIAQIMEILKVINQITSGKFYRFIRRT